MSYISDYIHGYNTEEDEFDYRLNASRENERDRHEREQEACGYSGEDDE